MLHLSDSLKDLLDTKIFKAENGMTSKFLSEVNNLILWVGVHRTFLFASTKLKFDLL